MSVEGHAQLGFRVMGVPSIMVKERRPSQFGGLPGSSPTLPPRSLPLGIRLVNIVAPFGNRLLAKPGGGFDARANLRGIQDPNEAFLCLV